MAVKTNDQDRFFHNKDIPAQLTDNVNFKNVRWSIMTTILSIIRTIGTNPQLNKKKHCDTGPVAICVCVTCLIQESYFQCVSAAMRYSFFFSFQATCVFMCVKQRFIKMLYGVS